ncbi:MAG TPA: MgtC/SapB family protein [Anaerolineales bacterium]|nr:MgtC/SapB family protein [Anaerolineales bacterium]
MVSLSDFEPWWRFGFALLIGALIGLEREFHQQRAEAQDFAGIRTFSLIALLGSVSAFLAEDFGIALGAVALAGLILLTTASYAGTLLRKQTESGITTEVAALLTFLFGVLVMGEHPLIAAALAVVLSLLLALKGRLHGFIRNMSSEDIHLTLQFALVAAVVLPLLPNRAIDPLGLFNPFQVWLMVVIVSGIGFSGYVLMKLLGPSRGVGLMGILGGLASSTATTISFSSASREYPDMAHHYARAVILASTVMLPRVLLLILVIHPPVAGKVLIPFAAMLLAGLVAAFAPQKSVQREEPAVHPEFKIANPLKLSTAIKFGILFAVVLVAVEYAQEFTGPTGVYLTGFLTGLTDVDAITLSVTRLAGRGQLLPDVAGATVLIAVLANTLTKGLISYFSGSPGLRGPVLRAVFLMILAGAVSGGLVFFLS